MIIGQSQGQEKAELKAAPLREPEGNPAERQKKRETSPHGKQFTLPIRTLSNTLRIPNRLLPGRPRTLRPLDLPKHRQSKRPARNTTRFTCPQDGNPPCSGRRLAPCPT